MESRKRGREAAEAVCWQLRRAFQELASIADRELQSLGVTASDRALLEFLARESGPISISELARRRSVSRQHIQQSLRRLPHRDWVRQSADPQDERIILLSLSTSGEAIWSEIRKRDKRFFSRLAASLGDSHLCDAERSLKEFRRAIERL